MTDTLRFGIFMAPFHKPGVNPTLALQNDLDLITWLDRCGYDEAWFGEHHSAGSEIIPSPELFIAAAAQNTKHIRLGTGVISLPYHNPLWVAERMVFLDHLTRGRAILGVGPGALPTDAAMVGLDPREGRPLQEVALKIIMQLLQGETVTFKNERWDLREARLHLQPYTKPHLEVVAAAVASPSGATLAGTHGAGLLSIGATMSQGFDALGYNWNIAEETAAKHGKTMDRKAWRLVGMCHVAETYEQAVKDVAYGIEHHFKYFQNVAAFPQMALPGNDVREMVEFVNTSGIGAIGTADMVREQIDRLWKQSNGGFGCYLMMAHNWANQEATRRSYEIIARDVFPHFQGHYQPMMDANDRAAARRPELAATHVKAVEEATARYQAQNG